MNCKTVISRLENSLKYDTIHGNHFAVATCEQQMRDALKFLIAQDEQIATLESLASEAGEALEDFGDCRCEVGFECSRCTVLNKLRTTCSILKGGA